MEFNFEHHLIWLTSLDAGQALLILKYIYQSINDGRIKCAERLMKLVSKRPSHDRPPIDAMTLHHTQFDRDNPKILDSIVLQYFDRISNGTHAIHVYQYTVVSMLTWSQP